MKRQYTQTEKELIARSFVVPVAGGSWFIHSICRQPINIKDKWCAACDLPVKKKVKKVM